MKMIVEVKIGPRGKVSNRALGTCKIELFLFYLLLSLRVHRAEKFTCTSNDTI